tara:strand:- start:6720 stop:7691 length:972 start_codon:yes stop_codon:yes gene_type:complete
MKNELNSYSIDETLNDEYFNLYNINSSEDEAHFKTSLKLKLPKFKMKLPGIKPPKIDIDIPPVKPPPVKPKNLKPKKGMVGLIKANPKQAKAFAAAAAAGLALGIDAAVTEDTKRDCFECCIKANNQLEMNNNCGNESRGAFHEALHDMPFCKSDQKAVYPGNTETIKVLDNAALDPLTQNPVYSFYDQDRTVEDGDYYTMGVVNGEIDEVIKLAINEDATDYVQFNNPVMHNDNLNCADWCKKSCDGKVTAIAEQLVAFAEDTGEAVGEAAGILGPLLKDGLLGAPGFIKDILNWVKWFINNGGSIAIGIIIIIIAFMFLRK